MAEISSKQLDATFNYLAKVALHIVPGLVVLETVFDRGFFAANVDSAVDLILLFTWAAVLSLPFEVATFALAPLLAGIEASLGADSGQADAWRRYARSQFQLGFLLPLLALMWFSDLALREFIQIPVLRYFANVLVVLLLAWPFAWLVRKAGERILGKAGETEPTGGE